MTNCKEINIEAERLKSIFGKCYNLKALDLRDVVDLIESVNACSNGQFELKTINGESLFGSGNIIVTADVDGTETKIQQGPGILISGSGSISNPYVITSQVDPADGSETKINQGSNISIGGTGTSSDPYVINAIMPSSEAQVNSDWSAISGPAEILNKPEIPLAQVNVDWNAVSGITMILNKPNTLNTNLGYVQSEFGGEITSSNGTSATIPLVSDEFPGLVSKEMLEALGNDLNNIKLEFEISMPTNETNEGFATSINTREFIEITGNQIPTFKAIKIDGEDSKIFYVEILGRGKGGYGVDGYQLSSEEVRFTSFNLTGGNIEDLPGTQIIDLGINSTDVVSVINSRIPNLIIQGQEDGYVLIKGTFNGTVYKEYLWIGEGGIYGGEIGASQANYSDLKELTIESVVRATSTSSGTVKTNLTVEDPVVYLKETSDLLLNEKENKANKSVDFSTINDTLFPTVQAVKTYADNLVVGMLNDRGTWNASGNVFPTTGGSGVGGTIRKGDMWYVSVEGTLGTKSVNIGDSFRALVNTPAQVTTNWSVLEANVGYVPENVANKSDSYSVSSTVTYPNTKALVDGLGTKISGTLTTNRIPKSFGTKSIGDSSINDNGTTVTTNLPIHANSFVKTAGSTNLLLASGSDITQESLPISNATQTVLDLKANLASPSLTGTPTAPTATGGTNTTQIATTAFVLANTQPIISHLEYNNTDKTVWNNGKGNVSGNTSFGDEALKSNTTGNYNTAFGVSALSNNTNNGNTAIGHGALANNVSGTTNVAIGFNAGSLSGGSNIVTSVFIGASALPLANSDANEIVIGYNAKGAGSNTATLGNTSITSTVLRGAVSGGSFIKSSAPTTNILLAGGGDIAQNTAFNKPFGTASGTVAEGNDSRILAVSTHTHGLGRHNLNAPAFIDGLTSSNFRDILFGSSAISDNISTSRWNNVPSALSGLDQFGNMLAWSGNDTHAFIATNNNSPKVRVGGGVNNGINWSKDLAFSDGTGASGTWEISISGTAANSTLWNGINYDPAFQDQPIAYILSRDGFSDTYKRTSDANVKNWLGLGSNAYNSTAYLPLSGGSLSGNLQVGVGSNVRNSNFRVVGSAQIKGSDIILPTGLGSISTEGGLGILNLENYGLEIDVLSSGNSYIQSKRVDSSPVAYNVLIQPLGGNVGIGTTTPSAKLDVNGTFKATGEATFSSSVTATSYTATSLPVFENNAAASSLAAGQFYRTSTGVLMVKF